MTRSTWLAATAGALVLGALSVTSEAAPAGSGATGYKTALGETSAAQDIHWRRHHRHYYYGYFGPPIPYWRYGPRYHYGYAPGIRFYYGPRHHHHHHHWRRWW